MKKRAIYALLLIFLLISLLYNVLHSVEYMDKIFIMDLNNGNIQQVANKKFNIDNIEWSANSQAFIFINHKSHILKAPYINRLMLFTVSDTNKGYQLDSSWNKEISGSFLRNDLILINKWGGDAEPQYILFDLKSGKTYKTQQSDINKYIPIEYAKAISQWNMYDIPGEISARIMEAAGSDYLQAVVNYNKDKVIFNTKDYKTYELDLLTNKSKFMFNGFEYNWSHHGTKIAYYVPKSISFENFDLDKGGQAEDFMTYVYDLEIGKSTKVADFAALTYFSYDDKYLVFYKGGYVGGRGEQ